MHASSSAPTLSRALQFSMHERIHAYEIMHAFTLRGAQPSFIALAESRFPQVLKQVLKQVLRSTPNPRRSSS